MFDRKYLHQVCDEVPQGDDETKLVAQMFTRIGVKGGIDKGIGLAANQVGHNKRIFVMDCNGMRQAFINPIITKMYGGTVSSLEGCLSFPGVSVLVARYKQVEISAFDGAWGKIKFRFKGLNAFCVQHEIDHLNGITMLKRKELGIADKK